MSLFPPAQAAIACDDLATLAEVAMLRFPLRAAESRRLERMRAVLAASTELGQAVSAYTHCALVNCQGSHGVGSVREQGVAFYAALERYAVLVRELADDYRQYTGEPGVGPLTLGEPGRTQLEVA
jgi:hypothetical protein